MPTQRENAAPTFQQADVWWQSGEHNVCAVGVSGSATATLLQHKPPARQRSAAQTGKRESRSSLLLWANGADCVGMPYSMHAGQTHIGSDCKGIFAAAVHTQRMWNTHQSRHHLSPDHCKTEQQPHCCKPAADPSQNSNGCYKTLPAAYATG